MLSMPDSGQAPGNTASVARLVWPLLLLIVGFWLVPLALTCQLQCVPGDLGDARFNNVVLEHFYRWLGGHEASLVSPGFFYPMPGALTFSDNHWGTAWIYAIFRALGWDRYQAFDLWFLCGYLLNFVASHYVFRRLRFSPLASALAAFAFTFAMPVVARYGHAQLTYRFLIPIGLLLWQCFRGDGRWRWLAALALAVAAQFYISIYLGYFMLLFLAAWALAQWLLEGWGPRQWFEQWQHYPQGVVRRELILASLTIVAAAVMIAVLMYPYLHYSKLYGFQRAAAEIASLLPRPQSYLLADSSGVWGGLSQQLATRMPMRHEQQIFFGLGILGLMGVGLFMSRLPSRWVALGAIVIVVALTLSVGAYPSICCWPSCQVLAPSAPWHASAWYWPCQSRCLLLSAWMLCEQREQQDCLLLVPSRWRWWLNPGRCTRSISISRRHVYTIQVCAPSCPRSYPSMR